MKPLCRRAQNQQAEGAKKRCNQLIYVIKHNAQLRGEQRYHQHIKHCAINIKFEVEAKMPSVVNPS
ncbi:hypothetical protein F6X00_11905 [Vibrio vulnificus]|nr:hypothetical protein F6X00_11905 [Vibrio vulnificus]